MKFSTRTFYGLKAILVLASRFGEGSLSVSQIARKEGISVAYLEQILNALKKKGFVKSVRGPQGGYILSKKPSEITLKALFYALEKPGFLEPNGRAPEAAGQDDVAAANLIFWEKLRGSIEETLEALNLKGILDEARRRKTKVSSRHTFNI
ncbi:MAG: Rrf2 family transcriptional regulator [Candidatus Omnitrophica bacterium]|nr:Rrf2 family transcriptional regulator [Candidatus Omnitrophota bacterium]